MDMPILFPGVAESLNARVLAAGYADVDSWWSETDLIREIWRLYLCDDDGSYLHVGKKRFPLPKNQIVIVPAGVDFDVVIESTVRQFYVHFEFVGWPPNAAREVVPEPVALEPDSMRDQLAADLRDSLHGAKEIGPILASRFKALIHLSIANVLENVTGDRAQSFLRIAEGQQELLAVLHYIDKHLDQSLNNTRLAEIAMASESRFIRRFREATGRTPGRYVQDRRLRRAAELLVSTEMTIDAIAELCGFANRYYFTRVFAQHMGCPPARYRSDQPFITRKSA
jgi:AraC-like DNA-binding protein